MDASKPGSWKAMQYDELNRDHVILKGQFSTLEERHKTLDNNYKFVWEVATQLLRAIEMYATASGGDASVLLTEVGEELEKLNPHEKKEDAGATQTAP